MTELVIAGRLKSVIIQQLFCRALFLGHRRRLLAIFLLFHKNTPAFDQNLVVFAELDICRHLIHILHRDACTAYQIARRRQIITHQCTALDLVRILDGAETFINSIFIFGSLIFGFISWVVVDHRITRTLQNRRQVLLTPRGIDTDLVYGRNHTLSFFADLLTTVGHLASSFELGSGNRITGRKLRHVTRSFVHTRTIGDGGLVYFHSYHSLGLRLQPHLAILFPRIEKLLLLLCLILLNIIRPTIVAHLNARLLADEQFAGAGLDLPGVPRRLLGARLRVDG